MGPPLDELNFYMCHNELLSIHVNSKPSTQAMCCIEASCAMKHTRLSSSKACGGACNGIAAEELQKLRLADRASPQRTLTSTPWPGKFFGKYLQQLRPLCEGETNDVDDRPAETAAWHCYHTVALCLSLRRPKNTQQCPLGFCLEDSAVVELVPKT